MSDEDIKKTNCGEPAIYAGLDLGGNIKRDEDRTVRFFSHDVAKHCLKLQYKYLGAKIRIQTHRKKIRGQYSM
jgi:hypothetical protein